MLSNETITLSLTHPSALVVHDASVDAQQLGLTFNGKLAFYKIILQRLLSDFGRCGIMSTESWTEPWSVIAQGGSAT
jgi:hypothetical protein